MIKKGFLRYASLCRCGRRICRTKSMEGYFVRRLFGLVYACSCLSVSVIVSCFGLVVNYVEFPYSLRTVESGTQI
jgi:hypothetical protein